MDHRGTLTGVKASGRAIDYQQIRRDLLTSYEGGAERRDQFEKQPWKLAERSGFARRLLAEGCTRMLEIGAGTGQDSEFFASRGLQVVATDLSPAMVARCRQKGIDGRVMDFANLEFQPGTFDAVHAMNCLLHVPNAEVPSVLTGIRDVLRVGGLFFLGVYSGDDEEGVTGWDEHVPPRFFSWRSDERLQQFARESFDIVDFHIVETGTNHRFQSLTLRRPA